jgi:glycosyltransferase involved in cell wall biosynthesis
VIAAPTGSPAAVPGRTLKIVHVSDYFQPALGYQEYFLARAHREMGYDVTVVTSDRYFPFPSYAESVEPVLGSRLRGAGRREERGVDVLRLASAEVPGRPFVWLGGLAETLARLAPDVVIGHDLLSPTSWRLARHRCRLGYRLVIDNHACDFNTRLDDAWSKRAYLALYRAVAAPAVTREACALVGIGRGEQELACRVLGTDPERVPIIPLGADTDLFHPSPEWRAAFRAAHSIAPGELVVVHAGKLSPEKDVHVLVEAVRDVAASGVALRLLLVGGGDPAYTSRLSELAGPGARRWLLRQPAVANADLPAVLAAADLGVWPGNFSQVIVEALAAGLPVVLPAEFSPGYPSCHLLAARNGLAFPRGDVAALRGAIESLVASGERRARMGAASRELVLERLSWRAAARRFLDVAGLAGPGGGPGSVPESPVRSQGASGAAPEAPAHPPGACGATP